MVAHQPRRPRPRSPPGGGDDARGHDLAELHGAYATAHEPSAAHPGRPARGRRRPREPALPRLRGAAVRLDRRPARPGGPVSRCESCGLGVVGEPGSAEEALRELGPARRRRTARGSPTGRASRPRSAAPAGPAWSRGARYLFTVEAVRRLVARRDQVVEARRWAPGAGIAAMWQTVLNSVTFGHNVALGALGRAQRRRPQTALAAPHRRPDQRRRWRSRRWSIALPLELVAAASARRRGLAALRTALGWRRAPAA